MTQKLYIKNMRYSKFIRLWISHTLVSPILNPCVLYPRNKNKVHSSSSSNWQATALARCTCPYKTHKIHYGLNVHVLWTECVGPRQLTSLRDPSLHLSSGSSCHQNRSLIQSRDITYIHMFKSTLNTMVHLVHCTLF